MDTIWGRAQQVVRHPELPVWEVGTASHGGLVVDAAWGTAHLGQVALSIAARDGGFLYFEEDCAWAAPIHEHAGIRAWILARRQENGPYNEEQLLSHAEATLRHWYPGLYPPPIVAGEGR